MFVTSKKNNQSALKKILPVTLLPTIFDGTYKKYHGTRPPPILITFLAAGLYGAWNMRKL